MDGVGSCGYDPQILYKPKIEYKTPTPAQRCEVGDWWDSSLHGVPETISSDPLSDNLQSTFL